MQAQMHRLVNMLDELRNHLALSRQPTVPLWCTQSDAILFFQLVIRRCGRASTVLTSNKGFQGDPPDDRPGPVSRALRRWRDPVMAARQRLQARPAPVAPLPPAARASKCQIFDGQECQIFRRPLTPTFPCVGQCLRSVNVSGFGGITQGAR